MAKLPVPMAAALLKFNNPEFKVVVPVVVFPPDRVSVPPFMLMEPAVKLFAPVMFKVPVETVVPPV